MPRRRMVGAFCAFILGLGLGHPALALDVVIDGASARAVLAAVQDTGLDRPEALRVAALPGNEALVRKARTYGLKATTDTFADALLAAAHGQPATDRAVQSFQLDAVRARAPALAALIDRIEAHPDSFRDWVIHRVETFSPKGAGVKLTGYLVAGGNSGGFAFDEPAFYLNLGYFDEFDPARVVMAHELYHAVQAAFAPASERADLEHPEVGATATAARCATLSKLFSDLYQEGSASLVGDPLMLDPTTGPLARKTREDMADGVMQIRHHATLLDLSVTGIEAPEAVPYERIYDLDFYVPEPLYKLGYVMAKAIVADRGAAALAELLSKPGYAFASAYLDLPKYDQDFDHPHLGANTREAVARLSRGCETAPG